MIELTKEELIWKTGRVLRHHTDVPNRPQNTADHQWGVTQLALLWFREYIDHMMIEILLGHDKAEYWTGDLPAPIKWQNPELGKALKKVEIQLDLAIGVPASHTPIRGFILKVCDISEYIIFAKNEINTGNRNFCSAFDRAMRFLEKLIFPCMIVENDHVRDWWKIQRKWRDLNAALFEVSPSDCR